MKIPYRYILLALSFFVMASESGAGPGPPNCGFTVTTNLVFPAYDISLVTATAGTGQITVLCNKNRTVNIAIGPSAVSLGYNPRQMKDPAWPDLLNYNLYTAAGCASVWGDNPPNLAGPFPSRAVAFPMDTPTAVTIFGCIQPGQDVTPSAGYADRVMITILY